MEKGGAKGYLQSTIVAGKFGNKRNATGDVEVLQKTETASESIGLEIRKAKAGKRTKLGAFLFYIGFIFLLLLFG